MHSQSGPNKGIENVAVLNFDPVLLRHTETGAAASLSRHVIFLPLYPHNSDNSGNRASVILPAAIGVIAVIGVWPQPVTALADFVDLAVFGHFQQQLADIRARLTRRRGQLAGVMGPLLSTSASRITRRSSERRTSEALPRTDHCPSLKVTAVSFSSPSRPRT